MLFKLLLPGANTRAVTTPDDYDCIRSHHGGRRHMAITSLAPAAPLAAIVGNRWVCLALVISLLGDSLSLLGLHKYSYQLSLIRASCREPWRTR